VELHRRRRGLSTSSTVSSFSRLQDQTRKAIKAFFGQDPKHRKVRGAYAFPREKSINRFMDQIRALTRRRVPLEDQGTDREIKSDPAWLGNYYKKAHVRSSSTD